MKAVLKESLAELRMGWTGRTCFENKISEPDWADKSSDGCTWAESRVK